MSKLVKRDQISRDKKKEESTGGTELLPTGIIRIEMSTSSRENTASKIPKRGRVIIKKGNEWNALSASPTIFKIANPLNVTRIFVWSYDDGYA